MTAKSSKWQATQPRNAFFLFGFKIMIIFISYALVALLMKTLSSLENSGALPRLTQTTNTSVEVATGVNADKTATLMRMLQVGWRIWPEYLPTWLKFKIPTLFCLHCQFWNVIWKSEIWVLPSLASLASTKCTLQADMARHAKHKILLKHFIKH